MTSSTTICSQTSQNYFYIYSQLAGIRFSDVEVNAKTMTSLLRAFIIGRNGYEDEMSDWLKSSGEERDLATEVPDACDFQELDADRQASVMHFVCSELVSNSRIIASEIDKILELQSNHKRDKWAIEMKIRKIRMAISRRLNTNSTNTDNQSETGEKSKQSEDEQKTEKEEDHNPILLPPEPLNHFIDIELPPSDEESVPDVSDLEARIDRLQKTCEYKQRLIDECSYKLSGSFLGQDRYKRNYYVLGGTGGIFVEGGPIDFSMLKSDPEDVECGFNVGEILKKLTHRKKLIAERNLRNVLDDKPSRFVAKNEMEEQHPVKTALDTVKTPTKVVVKVEQQMDVDSEEKKGIEEEKADTSPNVMAKAEEAPEVVTEKEIKEEMCVEEIKEVEENKKEEEIKKEDENKEIEKNKEVEKMEVDEVKPAEVTNEVKSEESLPKETSEGPENDVKTEKTSDDAEDKSKLTSGTNPLDLSFKLEDDECKITLESDKTTSETTESTETATKDTEEKVEEKIEPEKTYTVDELTSLCNSAGIDDAMLATSALLYVTQSGLVEALGQNWQAVAFQYKSCIMRLVADEVASGEEKPGAFTDCLLQLKTWLQQSGEAAAAGTSGKDANDSSSKLPVIDEHSEEFEQELQSLTNESLKSLNIQLPAAAFVSEEERKTYVVPEEWCADWWQLRGTDKLSQLFKCLANRGAREKNLMRSLRRIEDMVTIAVGVDNSKIIDFEKADTDMFEPRFVQVHSRRGKGRGANNINALSLYGGAMDTSYDEETGLPLAPGKKRPADSSDTGAEHLGPGGAKQSGGSALVHRLGLLVGGGPISDEQQAFINECVLIEDVEALEDRVLNSSLQSKGWQASVRAIEDDTLQLIPHRVAKRSRFERHPMDLVREKLLQLEENLERRYLLPPFVSESTLPLSQEAEEEASSSTTGNSTSQAPTKQLLDWRHQISTTQDVEVVRKAIDHFAKCVAWHKSIMKVVSGLSSSNLCQICRKDNNEAQLLLCDGCDHGYHTYCFRPVLEVIPEGNWFCFDCQSRRGSHKLCFICGQRGQEGACISSNGEVDMDSVNLGPPLAICDQCGRCAHGDCLKPALIRIPRRWMCAVCSRVGEGELRKSKSTTNSSDVSKSSANVDVGNEGNATTTGEPSTIKKPSKSKSKSKSQKSNKEAAHQEEIKDTTDSQSNSSGQGANSDHNSKSKHKSSKSDKSSKSKSRSKKQAAAPSEGKESSKSTKKNNNACNVSNSSSTKKSIDDHTDSVCSDRHTVESAPFNGDEYVFDEQDENSHHTPVSNKSSSVVMGNDEIGEGAENPLAEDAIPVTDQILDYCRNSTQAMIDHVMSWPFRSPVNVRLVPIYKKVIKKPMDLSTVYKRTSSANRSSYKTYQEWLEDVRQIFRNCETFNEDDSEIGKAGHVMRDFFENTLAKLPKIYGEEKGSDKAETGIEKHEDEVNPLNSSIEDGKLEIDDKIDDVQMDCSSDNNTEEINEASAPSTILQQNNTNVKLASELDMQIPNLTENAYHKTPSPSPEITLGDTTVSKGSRELDASPSPPKLTASSAEEPSETNVTVQPKTSLMGLQLPPNCIDSGMELMDGSGDCGMDKHSNHAYPIPRQFPTDS